jgi:transposase
MPDKSYAQRLVQARTGRDLEEHLREMYIARRYSDREIAELLGVSRTTVRQWRGEFGIGRDERTATLS